MADLSFPSIPQGSTSGWDAPLKSDIMSINAQVNAIGDTGSASGQERATAILGSSVVNLPSTATATIMQVTLQQNAAINFPLLGAGKGFTLILKQDATGSRTVSWPSTVYFSNGTAPTLTTAAGRSDVFRFFSPDGATWIGFTEVLNIPTPAQAGGGGSVGGITVKLDDTALTYSGTGWQVGTDALTYNSGDHYASAAGNTATFTATFVAGGTISIIAKKAAHHGIFTVSVDGGAATSVDLYAAAAAYGQTVWTSAALTAGAHTILITVTGTKNASSTGTVTELDALQLTGAVEGTGGVTPPDPTVPAPPTTAQPTGFLTRNGARLQLNGVNWRATGINCPWTFGCGSGEGLTPSLAHWTTLFQNAAPNSIYRIFCFGGANLATFDAILNAARPYGHRFILCLSDQMNGCGERYNGPNPAAFYAGGWISGGWRDNHLTPVINRYKNEPLIGWWEWVNECAMNQSVRDFFDACGSYVRNTLGDRHLIGSGTTSEYSNSTGLRLLINSPHIDISSQHEYDWTQSPSGWTSADNADAASATGTTFLNPTTSSAGKPWYVGESGIKPSQLAAGSARAARIASKITALKTSWPACTAFIYWTGAAPGFVQGDRMEISITNSPEITTINTTPML